VYLIEGRDRFAARRFPFVRTFEIGTAPSPGGAPTPPSALDAIQDYKASVSGNEVTVEVFYSYDSARRGPIYAVVSLLYQGKRIAAPREKPQILTQPAGSVRTPLLVRPNVGRQSDELEVVLFDDKARIASRRFPFARTFDGTP
jgi:hypothetical protein